MIWPLLGAAAVGIISWAASDKKEAKAESPAAPPEPKPKKTGKKKGKAKPKKKGKAKPDLKLVPEAKPDESVQTPSPAAASSEPAVTTPLTQDGANTADPEVNQVQDSGTGGTPTQETQAQG